MLYAGILAAGIGSRMVSSQIPKQFIKIGNIPIIIRTIRKFLFIQGIEKVIVALNRDYFIYFHNLIKEYDIDETRIIVVEGGTSRFESLINIARKAYELHSDSIVISHDCARPFVSMDIILENISKIKSYDAVTTSIPTIDTIVISKDGTDVKSVTSVEERREFFMDQGPQTFYAGKFLDLISKSNKQDISNYIEVGKLYLDNNLKIGIVKGNRENFKITTEFDLSYSEFLIKEGVE